MGLELGSCIHAGSESVIFNVIKNILICVPNMNEGLTGSEQHEGEKLMTEFSLQFLLL